MTTPELRPALTITWSPDCEELLKKFVSFKKRNTQDTHSKNWALNKESHPKEAELD